MAITVRQGNTEGNGKGASNKGSGTIKKIRTSSQTLRSDSGEKDNSGDSGSGDGDPSSKRNGRRKKTDQPLEVQVTFVEISDEEREEHLNKITEMLIDSALRELKVSTKSLTGKEDKLQ